MIVLGLLTFLLLVSLLQDIQYVLNFFHMKNLHGVDLNE